MTDSKPNLDPTTNNDAQEGASLAHSNIAVILIPLTSGNIAVVGRDFQVHTILTDAPSMEEIRRLSREIHAKIMAQARIGAEARFYGEPSERQWARDLKRAAKPTTAIIKSSIETIDL
jgi:hypothetical protein